MGKLGPRYAREQHYLLPPRRAPRRRRLDVPRRGSGDVVVAGEGAMVLGRPSRVWMPSLPTLDSGRPPSPECRGIRGRKRHERVFRRRDVRDRELPLRPRPLH